MINRIKKKERNILLHTFPTPFLTLPFHCKILHCLTSLGLLKKVIKQEEKNLSLIEKKQKCLRSTDVNDKKQKKACACTRFQHVQHLSNLWFTAGDQYDTT